MTQTAMEKLIELKGDKEYVPMPNARLGSFIEDVGKYKDHYYCIVFNVMTPMFSYRCGYIELLPSEARISKKRAESFEMHGGLTYFQKWANVSKNKWMGFDAMHYQDMSDLETRDKVIKLFPEVTQTLEWIAGTRIINNMPNELWSGGFGGEIRTKEYMIEQCKQLIDQIIDIDQVADYEKSKKSKKISENKI